MFDVDADDRSDFALEPFGIHWRNGNASAVVFQFSGDKVKSFTPGFIGFDDTVFDGFGILSLPDVKFRHRRLKQQRK